MSDLVNLVLLTEVFVTLFVIMDAVPEDFGASVLS